MSQLDALRLADNLRQRIVDFALDDNFVRNSELTNICRSVWEGDPNQGGLISDLWVEGAFPSKASSHTLDTLVRDGQFDPNLRDVLDKSSAMPRGRRLYTHQYEAIERAQLSTEGKRPSIVVTAGTGAGKTESFLLPILNDLYQNLPLEKHGAKCIILYPMNALVNDQVDRLYEWLKDQARVRLFHFTSETPEDRRWANSQNVPRWKPCRMRTRQEARGLESHDGQKILPENRGPTPDIIITNYSMLEYMLCRPQDSVFFGPGLRAVVLDEAHLYTGTLAAEITLLLRRLLLRCGRKPEDVLQIATSATLGTGDTEELRGFASQIFSKPAGMVHVITGEMDRAPMELAAPPAISPTAADIAQNEWLDGPTIVEDENGKQELAVNQESCEKLRARLDALVSKDCLKKLDANENHPAILLHETLAASPLIHKLEDILWNKKHIPLVELGTQLFGENAEQSTKAVTALLQLAASARLEPTSYPLVSHRIHIMVRPSDGLTVCLNGQCSGPPLLSPLGTVSSGYQDTCGYCDNSTLTLQRCVNCGEWLLAGQEKGSAIIAAVPRPGGENPGRLLFSISHSHTAEETRYIHPATGEIQGSRATNAIKMYKVSECPNCQAANEDIRSFFSGSRLILSILAETLLAEMPEFPSKAGSNLWLPAKGRRLLAFSDSRREAARLGPLLTNQHELQLVRSAIVKVIQNTLIADEEVLQMLGNQIEQSKENLKDFNLTPAMRRFREDELKRFEAQLSELSAGGSIETWSKELSELPILHQVLDRNTSNTHEASKWSQKNWDDNRRVVKKRAEEFLGRELARGSQTETLESFGLIEVTYPDLKQLEPPPSFLGTLPTEDIRENLRQNWTNILASLCDTLRAEGVITLGDELDSNYPYIGRWTSAREVHGALLTRFIGQTSRQRRRWFASAILKSCGLSDEVLAESMASDLLQTCFDQLREGASRGSLSWLETEDRQADSRPVPAVRIIFARLGLRRPPDLFQCQKTRRVWPRNVVGCAPNIGCDRTLKPVTTEDLDNDPKLGRRRREYSESHIFKMGLWAEEHSAQLNPKENRRLQNLFKSGIRNILSATTTLELGIDIGGLNGVLMSNVPPGKANYLQRAGRAGRRADGSSLVATFSRPRPFDREVFGKIGDYLDQKLRRPVVFLNRERVVRRHLNSLFLNEFFKYVYGPSHTTGAMDAFGKMGAFCGARSSQHWKGSDRKPDIKFADILHFEGDGGPPSWWDFTRDDEGLEKRFIDFLNWLKLEGESAFREHVRFLLKDTSINLDQEGWEGLIQQALCKFVESVKDWREEYDLLLTAWQNTNNKSQANALHYQLRTLSILTVIEALGDRQFLPRYGFPIGVQKLKVIEPDERRYDRIREEDQYRLERSSLLALREYVPGSQLLAGGKLVTSRGVLKHWTGLNIQTDDTTIGLRGRYAVCKNDHFYYWDTTETHKDCIICGESARENSQELMFPKYGFSGAAWDPPKWSTDTEFVGQTETEAMMTAMMESTQNSMNFGAVPGLVAYYKEDSELLVYNRGEKERGFAICLRCGFAESEKDYGAGAIGLPHNFKYHAPLTSTKLENTCWPYDSTYVLRNQTLAAREVTDGLLLDFSGCLGEDAQRDRSLVTTLGYGLQRAAAKMLQLDGREIGVLTTPAGQLGQGLGALLYDNVPGGAGHVRELLESGRDWLELTRDILYINEAHNSRCKSACLDCLLSFETQDALSYGLLERPYALAVLSSLLDKGAVSSSTSKPKNDLGPQSGNPASIQQLSPEERLNRAKDKKRSKRRPHARAHPASEPGQCDG